MARHGSIVALPRRTGPIVLPSIPDPEKNHTVKPSGQTPILIQKVKKFMTQANEPNRNYSW